MTTETTAPLRGRPKKSAEDKRASRFVIKLTAAEREQIETAAGAEPSAWARDVLLRAAKRRQRAE